MGIRYWLISSRIYAHARRHSTSHIKFRLVHGSLDGWTQSANQSVYFGNAPRFGMIFDDIILNAEDALVVQPVHELAHLLGS